VHANSEIRRKTLTNMENLTLTLKAGPQVLKSIGVGKVRPLGGSGDEPVAYTKGGEFILKLRNICS
jgi:hypothetical protein